MNRELTAMSLVPLTSDQTMRQLTDGDQPYRPRGSSETSVTNTLSEGKLGAGSQRPDRRKFWQRAVRASTVVGGVFVAALAWEEHTRTGLWLPGAAAVLEAFLTVLLLTLRPLRVLAFNGMAVLLVFVGAEAYLLWGGQPTEPTLQPPLREWRRVREPGSDIYSYPSPLWQRDDVLGWIATPNATARERRYVAGHLVYEATFHTGRRGFRVVPPASAQADAVFLFGCSITWGFGLNDGQSYPWQLGEMLGNGVQVFNFGIVGTGPNVMLRMIEGGYERESLPQGRVVGAYYLAWLNPWVGHLARILGRTPWGNGAPRYRVGSGAPELAMQDGQLPNTFDQWLGSKSLVTQELVRGLAARRMNTSYTAADIDLLSSIVAESDRRLKLNDGTPLTVLIITDRAAHDVEELFIANLAARGVRALRIELPLAGYLMDRAHPNFLGAHALAETVYRDLNKQHSDDSSPALKP